MDQPGLDQPDKQGEPTKRLRRWILWVLVLGLAGVEAELLLLEHYEDPWQLIPIILVALAAVVLIWQARQRDAASLLALRSIMVLFLIAGFLGLALHFRGAAQFQLEIDPAIGTWDLVGKVMRAKAPPLLAPGVMLQLGLIGLAYAFSDSRANRSERP